MLLEAQKSLTQTYKQPAMVMIIIVNILRFLSSYEKENVYLIGIFLLFQQMLTRCRIIQI